MTTLPFLTKDLPAIPGAYKARPADFGVEEIPAYEPCGEGSHVYFSIQKTGMTTPDAVRAVSRSLGVSPHAVGYAGMKDARGVTRQTLSVEHVDPARVAALSIRNLEVLWVSRHGNKLRTGHTRGNRFEIRVRGCGPEHEETARAVLEVLIEVGLPNYFGEQRFGTRGDNWKVGRALLAGDEAEAVAQIAGRPSTVDTSKVLLARQLFEKGDYEASARAWPGGFRDCVRLSKAMARRPDPARALRALDRSLLRFYVSAYQSHLFNQVVASRVDSLGQLQTGDLAWRHANGAVFTVEDTEREQPRADALEISPSGPLFGRRMTRPTGEVGQVEDELLARFEHTHEDFQGRGPLQWRGGRRPLRVPLTELELESGEDDAGECLSLRFALPSGSYATAVLREVLKPSS
jgi:tRNA pseudouridine13 synthase